MSLLKGISEAVPSNAEEWQKAELAAWKERFPKAKSKSVSEFKAEFPKHEYRRQDDVVALKLGEQSLIELVNNAQTVLKTSDSSDAGKLDVVNKALGDIGFNLMRNTINSAGEVTGSDVADYIERAEDLNDEVDTVPFGLETDNGQIVKVYVNAEQADAFEEAMKNMLGMEDDIEEAINRLTTEFDIVDVVWPKGGDEGEGGDGEEEDPDADLSIDDDFNNEDDDFADGNFDDVSSDAEGKEEREVEKDEAEEAKAELDPNDGDSDDDAEDEEDDDDPDGDKPKKKKKKKAQPAEPATESTRDARPTLNESKESSMTIGSKFLSRVINEELSPLEKRILVWLDWYETDDRNKNRYTKSGAMNYVERCAKHEMPNQVDKIMKLAPPHVDDKLKELDSLPKRRTEGLKEAEAAQDRDGVKDGFNIPLDSQARALAGKLRLPFAKRLIAFHVMCGVPGRYLNSEDAEGAIAGAADMLRKKPSVRKAFLGLYEGLATSKGYSIEAPAEDAVKEARQVSEASRKGSYMQKLLEAVMSQLGLPESLTVAGAPSAVSTGIYRTSELIESDSGLERNLRLLATRLGIKATDVAAQVEEEKKPVKEAVDIGSTDPFMTAVLSLCEKLGVPDTVIGARKSQLVQGLRAKKSTLRNRQQLVTMMQRLEGLIDKNTVAAGSQKEDDETNESVSPTRWKFLSALTEVKESEFKVEKKKNVNSWTVKSEGKTVGEIEFEDGKFSYRPKGGRAGEKFDSLDKVIQSLKN